MTQHGTGGGDLFERARALLLAGNLPENLDAADALLRQGRADAPADGAMAYLHGLCLGRAGNWAAAAEAFADALRLDPDDGRAALMLSRALRVRGDAAGAGRVRAELAARHVGDAGLMSEAAADL